MLIYENEYPSLFGAIREVAFCNDMEPPFGSVEIELGDEVYGAAEIVTSLYEIDKAVEELTFEELSIFCDGEEMEMADIATRSQAHEMAHSILNSFFEGQ